MKLQIQKITKPIELKEYHEGYGNQKLHVWVNPTRNIRREREEQLDAIQKRMAQEALADTEFNEHMAGADEQAKKKLEAQLEKRQKGFAEFIAEWNEKSYQWLSVIWSQGEDTESHWTPDEIKELDENDPSLAAWLVAQTVEMQNQQRDLQKKA